MSDPQWQTAQLVEAYNQTATLKTLIFKPTNYIPHLAGQHYDLRLTASDGYQAQRAYSLANPHNDEGLLEFGVQLIAEGEVSPYLYQMSPGEELEIKGPIGRHFVCTPDNNKQLVLIAGGSGVVPVVSILRQQSSKGDALFIGSFRSELDIPYLNDLESLAEKTYITLTREQSSTRPFGRLDKETLDKLLSGKHESCFYICGSTSFVETIADTIVELGVSADRIMAERFGG